MTDASGSTAEHRKAPSQLHRENEDLKRLVAKQTREIRWLRFVSKLD